MTHDPVPVPPAPGLKVLVLEDAADVRERLLPLVAETAGLQLLGVATSVTEAREVLRTLEPDVALLDLRLPDGSGLDLLHEIRARNAGAFVAILTAFDTPHVRRACLAAGADAFLSKTSGLDELPALLAAIAAGSVRA